MATRKRKRLKRRKLKRKGTHVYITKIRENGKVYLWGVAPDERTAMEHFMDAREKTSGAIYQERQTRRSDGEYDLS